MVLGRGFRQPILQGAIIQLLPDFGTIVPNIIPFQYNPEKVTCTSTPWDPSEVDQTKRGAPAPMVQPYDPEKTYDFSLEFDAADDIQNLNPVAIVSGVASRLAAVEKLLLPSEGLFGDLIASAKALTGNSGIEREATRPTVPIALLVLGPSVIYPIRVLSSSTEIIEFTRTLHPRVATVTLSLRVLTPEAFQCETGPAKDIAVAAYNLTKVNQDALAVANITNALTSTLSLLPF